MGIVQINRTTADQSDPQWALCWSSCSRSQILKIHIGRPSHWHPLHHPEECRVRGALQARQKPTARCRRSRNHHHDSAARTSYDAPASALIRKTVGATLRRTRCERRRLLRSPKCQSPRNFYPSSTSRFVRFLNASVSFLCMNGPYFVVRHKGQRPTRDYSAWAFETIP